MDLKKKIKRKIASFKGRFDYPERYPVAVYRLQFNRAFTFRDAAKPVSYLHDLGITDVYASPYFKARRGSQHGYDVSDQNSLNPELGTWEDYTDFVDQLQKHDMGQVLDFVPNHMSIFDNPKWNDVLGNGPSSIYARYFDIDWQPVKAELHRKVLLPLLDDLYGEVLEKGQISLGFERGAFFILYREHSLPVGPKTAIPVLESSLNILRENLKESDLDFLELQSIITACKNLPEQRETEFERMMERRREKEIIKKRLDELCRNNENIKSAIEETVKLFNGRVGDNASFIKLHELLEKQGYRLSFWRVASEEINYRRFFDNNELVALRMEDPAVFAETHQLLRELVGKSMISGIRIDHVDGLFNPAEYLTHLQEEGWIERVITKLKDDPELSRLNLKDLHSLLVQNINRDFREKYIANFRPLYIVVEKILGENEEICQDWPVAGTTGYEFMTALNQLFVDRNQERKMLNTYRRFASSTASFEDIAYNCKNLVMKTTMASEINMLAHQLNIVSEQSWQYRDFTINSLRDALREVIACFPVYRTYINAYSGSVSQNDRNVILKAIDDAKRRNPAVSSAVFDFVHKTLLLRYPTGMKDSGCNLQRLFVMRFQQLTGPVIAKGVEDTAFYVYNPLVSLNEVGSNPRQYGISLQEFHRQNLQRQKAYPYSFITSSTHDSKRGEDVRARINVLSEIPGEWRTNLERWSQLNRDHKLRLNGNLVPDDNDEYLLYQTLLGTCPVENMTERGRTEYCRRIQNYMLKAIKEAKVHSSWISPNTEYENGVSRFVEKTLDPSPQNLFLTDFKSLNQIIATCGMYNSLSQVVLKIFSPGVPDIYQGNELWAFNLTDPDNRAPVDYRYRVRMLHQLKKQASDVQQSKELIQELLNKTYDGRIKLYTTWKSLKYRRENRDLFAGNYLPLKSSGLQKDHVCAFAWKRKEKTLLVAVPRFFISLTHRATMEPLGEAVWKESVIVLPQELRYQRYHNIFTNETIQVHKENGSDTSLCEVFQSFPVAALESF
jgi:(1->4)-alpha-D-glucan 1-alpha-D-glucosylmutase